MGLEAEFGEQGWCRKRNRPEPCGFTCRPFAFGNFGFARHLAVGVEQFESRIEGCLESRICTIVEPLTYGQGPFGEDSHDARTLLMAQGDLPACEFRLVVDRVYKDLFSNVLRVLSQPGISLVSARVDERSACQIQ